MEISRRPRRLRSNEIIRRMAKENFLKIDDLIYPLFVDELEENKKEIKSMPGQYRYSLDELVKECKALIDIGINKIILFGIPGTKDEIGSQAYDDDGITQRAVKTIKENFGDKIYILTDVCLCEYTSHGHCGLIDNKGKVLNDQTVKLLAKTALSHVKAGADMVAPSDMMDGRIKEIRKELDDNGYTDIPIMAYSAKYASSYYGPFREAADSAPCFGDRKTYQMDTANQKEALTEVALDIEEGADIVIVKPALAYLDVVAKVRENFSIPVVAYSVSGEYSMLKMAIENGLLNSDIVFESLLSIKRAGADMIITYFAKEIAESLKRKDKTYEIYQL
ncbi:porphobilinogen synthase [Alkalibacter mobilis]|uniref:porphobilinogen synthase n=1 Tax=Alkalibacter mobilis TaxID=2787712 RepID=UPI00189F6BF7|nr:porphobilinogen synthase [Alkalibacter mobilis]MBF7097167.1 porphobilinogen synthase [Alkalibacter mobilis]